MTTPLRSLYESLPVLSTSEQADTCRDFIQAFRSPGCRALADQFVESFEARKAYTNLEQPFLDAAALSARAPLTETSRGTNRVVYLLSQKEAVRILEDAGDEVGRFAYRAREVPPLRMAGAGVPRSGAGGIDYVGLRSDCRPPRPVLGEIKYDNDQNPFYALVQLLTYLSEMAPPAQRERAARHRLFGDAPADGPFDLHVVLADFNDRGEKGPLVGLARELAVAVKAALAGHAEIAPLLGDVFCLRMNTTVFAADAVGSMRVAWRA